MKKIATLGPEGTFSDAATKVFMRSLNEDSKIEYYSSIKNALSSIGMATDYGVLPIENLSEGFISLVLDHLVEAKLHIIGEVLLPIQFSFIGNAVNELSIKQLYVQFVARGQCSEFIDTLKDIEIVTTDSNIESLNKLTVSDLPSGAIVPAGSYEADNFSLTIDNVNDYKNNKTRFLAFASSEYLCTFDTNYKYKTTIIVIDDNDRPGLLESILSPFTKRQINLTSIVSHPSGQELGKYHFFIDFEGHISDEKVGEVLGEISMINKVKVIGSYLQAKSV